MTTGGNGTAYTLATNEGFTALVDGMTVAFRPHVANGASATLAVDGLAAKPLRVLAAGVAIPANALAANVVCDATYYLAGDEFVVKGRGYLDAPTGTRMLFSQVAAPLGWAKEVGGAYDNAALRIVTGSGGGTGGTAGFSTVFAARTIAIANLPAGTIGTAQAAGLHDHGTATQAAGAHAHAPAAGTHFWVAGAGGVQFGGGSSNAFSTTGSTNNSPDHTHGINADGSHTHTVASAGSGTPIDFDVKYADVFLATKL